MTLAVMQRGRESLVDGEFILTAGEFAQFAAMLQAEAGIVLGPGKAMLLYSRLAKRLRMLGLSSFAEYWGLVSAPGGAAERGRMVAAMTTNVTRFFREQHHFDHLRTQTLPPLLKAAQTGARIRIWSAACSTGQEPYSIALTILALTPDASRLDLRILATDIDPNVLARGQAGVYSAEEMAPVPSAMRQRWFRPVGDGTFAAIDAVRGMVAFRPLNLVGSWPMRGPFDAVMCRNVVIYFDDATQATIWRRFAPLLRPGGSLYIGHSERLSGPAAMCFDVAGTTVYRRNGAAA